MRFLSLLCIPSGMLQKALLLYIRACSTLRPFYVIALFHPADAHIP